MSKPFGEVFESFDETFKKFDKIFKGSSKESKSYSIKSGLMNHILCQGNCGRTVFKFPEKTLLRHPSGGVVYCTECAGKLKLPLLTKIKNWWK